MELGEIHAESVAQMHRLLSVMPLFLALIGCADDQIEADEHSRTTVYKARTADNSIAITITGANCQDSMSGETFSATVSVVLNNTRYSGCGRALR